MSGSEKIVQDLVAAGVPVRDVWDLVNTSKQYRQAIPVLIRWLEHLEAWSEPSERRSLEEGIVRSLTVPAARGVATPVLIKRFRDTAYDTAHRWVIGNALGVVADSSFYDEIMPIVTEPGYGIARQMIVEGLAKWKDPRTVPVLIDLLSDPDVAAHAAHALGLLRAKEARGALIQLGSNGSVLQRREARTALRRLSPGDG